MMVNILPYELRCEELEERHSEILQKFKSSEKELEDFLKENALEQENMTMSRTYLFFHNPSDTLVGYISILNDKLELKNKSYREKFKEKGIRYSNVPAMKIGRLSTHKEFEKKSIGTFLIAVAMKKAVGVNDASACRLLIVDSKKNSIGFYEKKGFTKLIDQSDDGESTLMFKDLHHIIKNYKEKKRNLINIDE